MDFKDQGLVLEQGLVHEPTVCPVYDLLTNQAAEQIYQGSNPALVFFSLLYQFPWALALLNPERH